MRLCLAVPVLLAAASCGDDGPHPINKADASVPLDASFSYGTYLKLAFPAALSGDKPLLNTIEINTDTSAMCDQTNSRHADFCVIAGATIEIGDGTANVPVISAAGSKPLVLLASQSISLDGTLDVSSHTSTGPTDAARTGAGARATCSGATEATGTAGGYGGSFGGKGGAGGLGTGATAGTGGVSASASGPAALAAGFLLGGCPGGTGASPVAASAGTGGMGGGAVLLIAPSITFNGVINASGAAGLGGKLDATTSTGAGGGGSGGMIVLDGSVSPGTAATLYLFANGGGGGQGGTATGAGAGAGASGHESTAPATAGTGGAINTLDGGAGGNGSSGTIRVDGSPAGAAKNAGGGGAGGGGAGVIRAPEITGVAIAPPRS